MSITNEDDVRPLTVQKLRDSLSLTQKDFWSALGVSALQGHRYENGITKRIPRTVRRLVFLHYVVGIPTGENLEQLQRSLGSGIGNNEALKRLNQAEQSLKEARESLYAGSAKPDSTE